MPAGQAGGVGDQAQGDQEQGVHCQIVYPVVLCYNTRTKLPVLGLLPHTAIATSHLAQGL